MNDDIVQAHRRELTAGSHPLYGLLELIARADVDTALRNRVRPEVTRLIDVLLFQEIHVRVDDVIRSAEQILQQPATVIATAFLAWRRTLEGATNSRRTMRLIARRFGHWVAAIPPAVQNDVLDLLPLLSPACQSLKEAGMLELIGRISRLPYAGQRDALRAALTAYADTTAAILGACCRLVEHAARTDRIVQFNRLVKAVPVQAMEESIDAERLLPAIDRWCSRCAAIDDAACGAALDLSVALASRNHTSACHAVTLLHKRVRRMRQDALCDYLDDVRSLVESVGMGILGFTLRRLPLYYATHDPATVRRFVRTAITVRDQTGVTAAHRFLETRTAAARSALDA